MGLCDLLKADLQSFLNNLHVQRDPVLNELIEHADLYDCLVEFDEAVQGLNILDGVEDEADFNEGLEHIVYLLGQVQPI